MDQVQTPYRLLSLDGGGIRGLLTARILERIVEQRPDFLDQVHLFAGTSTGAILAVALAKGISPSELVKLYQEKGQDIFHQDIWHRVGAVWGLMEARYTTENRLNTLRPYFADITLKDLLPRHVLVTTFQLDADNPISPAKPTQAHTWKAKFFHNYEGDDSDGEQSALEVVMRSSAAPTYFPIYQGYVDGGVVANNPSMCALGQAIDQKNGGKQDIKNVALMSIGTGTKNINIPSTDGNWGLKQWGSTLLDLIFESGSGLADYQCRQLLDGCYLRLNPDLGGDVGLDDLKAIDLLLTAANNLDLKDTLRFIDSQWSVGLQG